MKTDDLLAGLPGDVLVREGLSDVQAGRRTIPACLVAIARPRFSRAGLISTPTAPLPGESELQLYRLLRLEGGDAYSRYNALIRELISFEAALDQRLSRRQSSPGS